MERGSEGSGVDLGVGVEGWWLMGVSGRVSAGGELVVLGSERSVVGVGAGGCWLMGVVGRVSAGDELVVLA